MNVIIQIKGREAIPVRALPWLTNWEFSACAVADAFSQYHYPWANGIQAYRLDDDAIQAVPRGEWRNTVDATIEELYERASVMLTCNGKPLQPSLLAFLFGATNGNPLTTSHQKGRGIWPRRLMMRTGAMDKTGR